MAKNIKTFEEIKDMKVGEFMEWFVVEYDSYYLPTDYDRTIAMLDGYKMGKGESEERIMIESAVNLLRNARCLLDIIKRYSGWKYK